MGDLGDADGTLESLMTSLDREPQGELAPGVHRNIALVYDSLGNASLAEEHRRLSREIQEAQEAATGE